MASGVRRQEAGALTQAVTGPEGMARPGSQDLAADQLELAGAVLAADDADGARTGAHDHGFGGGAVGGEADALDQGAVGDAGAGQENVGPLAEGDDGH